jgi:hypothetical protein
MGLISVMTPLRTISKLLAKFCPHSYLKKNNGKT